MQRSDCLLKELSLLIVQHFNSIYIKAAISNTNAKVERLLLCWAFLCEHSTGNLLHSFVNKMWIWQISMTCPSKSQC